MRLACTVVNYRTPDDLQQFLESWVLYGPRASLMIVNVSPQRRDMEVAESYQNNQNIFHAAFEENIGYAKACNFAATQYKSDLPTIYGFFNADVILRSNLQEFLVAMDANKWGVVGVRQVDQNNKIIHGGIFGTPQEPHWRGGCARTVDYGQFSDVREAVTVLGAAFFVRDECWDELIKCPLNPAGQDGAFLPTDFYFEETFVAYHARAHGWKVIYYGLESVVHKWSNSIKINNAEAWAKEKYKESQAMFRKACYDHGIDCD